MVDEIVFTAPDRATVRHTLKSDDPSIPAPGTDDRRSGPHRRRVEGVDRIELRRVALAGIECDYSLGDE